MLSASAARRARTHATAIRNMAAMIEAAAGARVAESADWRREGHRSPAEEQAKATGTSVSKASDALRTAERLQDQPAVAAATARGELSPEQVAAVADATAVAPDAEERLLGAARQLPLRELEAECGRTKVAHRDADEQARRIRQQRRVRSWTDAEGMGHIKIQGPVEDTAAIMARVNAERDKVFAEARAQGRQEPGEAYAFDAVVRICRGGGLARLDDKVIWRFDLDAFLRGYPAEGETTDVAGEAVPVSAVEDLLRTGSPFLAAVITKAERIIGVAHLGRAPTAKQQTALEWMYPTCAVAGCSQSVRLQRDHRVDWAKTKVTVLDLLDLLCAFHHGLKTTKGWGLVEGRGQRDFVPPDDPRHPRHANDPPAA